MQELINDVGMFKPEARRLLMNTPVPQQNSENRVSAVDLTTEEITAELKLLLNSGEVESVEYKTEDNTFAVRVIGKDGTVDLTLHEAALQCATEAINLHPHTKAGKAMTGHVKAMKSTLGLNNTELALIALPTLGNRAPMVVGEITKGHSSKERTKALLVVVCGFLLLKKANANLDFTKTINGGFIEDYAPNKKQRKEKTVYLLTSYPPHKDAMVDQLKANLVRNRDGTSTPDDGDYKAIADSVFQTLQETAETSDVDITALKAYTKESLKLESKVVTYNWWDQSKGKGPNTSTYIKTNFKESLRVQEAQVAEAAAHRANAGGL